jgi:hypothetical protein
MIGQAQSYRVPLVGGSTTFRLPPRRHQARDPPPLRNQQDHPPRPLAYHPARLNSHLR